MFIYFGAAARNFAHAAIKTIMCVDNGINMFNFEHKNGRLDIDDWTNFSSLPRQFYQGIF